MKKFLPLLLLLPLAGCEQKKPPTPEGRAKAAARTATGTLFTKLEIKTQPDPIAAGGVTIGDIKIFKIKDTPEGFREEWKDFKPVPETDQSTVSGVLMRSWLVEKEGPYLESIRPNYKGYGSFVTDFVPPRPGDYVLWTEYQPNAQENPMPMEFARKALKVKGTEVAAAEKIPVGTKTAQLFDRKAKATPNKVSIKHGEFRVGVAAEISWSLAGGATPENAEIIAVSPKSDDLQHFTGTSKKIEFTEPGIWRVWFVYGKEGARFYAPYAVRVKA